MWGNSADQVPSAQQITSARYCKTFFFCLSLRGRKRKLSVVNYFKNHRNFLFFMHSKQIYAIMKIKPNIISYVNAYILFPPPVNSCTSNDRVRIPGLVGFWKNRTRKPIVTESPYGRMRSISTRSTKQQNCSAYRSDGCRTALAENYRIAFDAGTHDAVCEDRPFTFHDGFNAPDRGL